ncbi:MAG: hypothetical protein M3P13_13220 [Acidobacteriota bacterium]|jgi:hypothetical protein|nr:hypothetical protein [Acidobacteriota bacterium]
MTKAVWGVGLRRAGAVGLILASVSCGSLTRQGTSSSYLIITSLEAAPGGVTAGTFGSVLLSDVIVVKDGVASIYSDQGRVTFGLGLKDPGPSTSPATPTQNNFITVNRYHVRYIRADGHNIEGVDVPYAFDDAFTVTVSGETTAGFTAVRNQAKQEAPLAALGLNPIVVSTLAEVTFYGHDQTGREVSAVGSLSVSFANFADPK